MSRPASKPHKTVEGGNQPSINNADSFLRYFTTFQVDTLSKMQPQLFTFQARKTLSPAACPSSGEATTPEKCIRAMLTTTQNPCQVYNHVNYTELKDYKYPECMGKAHDGNVRALIFVEEHTLLISASGDRSISIHDDSTVKGMGRGTHRLPHHRVYDCRICSNGHDQKRS